MIQYTNRPGFARGTVTRKRTTMIREFRLAPETLNAALRPIRAALAGVPGASVTVGAAERVVVRRFAPIETAHGHIDYVESARWGTDAVPVTVVIPEGALASPGWSLVLRREDVGGATAETWVQHREDAAARDAVRAALCARVAECQHCGKAIRRLSTSVVREVATGRLLQVGGTCEGHYVPATALKILKALAVTENYFVPVEYRDDDPEGGRGVGSAAYLWTADYLAALGHLFQHSAYAPSNHPNGNPNFDATWRQAWDRIGELAPYATELPAPVLEALRTGQETARHFEADGLISRREAAMLCGKARMAWLQAERGAAPKGECPEGRIVIEGTVVGKKLVDSPYGTVIKALIECGGGAYRVWGTQPAAASWEVDDRVRIKATVTRSPKDPAFGFFSRPSVA